MSETVLRKERSSNIELFRIVTMLLIVAHHYVVNSGLSAGPMNEHEFCLRTVFLSVFGAFGKMGINCFVLITGYFMCTSKITLKKYLKLLFEIEFYRITVYLLFVIFGNEKLTLSAIFNTVWPVKTISDGFTSSYILFFLFIPFINILIKGMSEKQYLFLLAVCLFAYTIIGTIPNYGISMNYISWFIIIYLIGAYIRLYDKRLFNSFKLWLLITASIFLLSVLSVILLSYLRSVNLTNLDRFFFLRDSNKLFAVALAISSFLLFKNFKIKQSKLINTLAASTFGVLLIHTNSATMRAWLWKDLLNNRKMYYSDFLVIHAVVSVLGVFVVCALIDYLRIKFLEKPFFKWYDKKFKK